MKAKRNRIEGKKVTSRNRDSKLKIDVFFFLLFPLFLYFSLSPFFLFSLPLFLSLSVRFIRDKRVRRALDRDRYVIYDTTRFPLHTHGKLENGKKKGNIYYIETGGKISLTGY